MNDLLKFSNEIANIANNTNVINIENLPKTEQQQKDEVVEMIYQKHLQAQAWGNNLNQELEITSTYKHRAKRGIPVDNIINYEMKLTKSSRLLFAFEKKLWTKISDIYNENQNSRATFVQKMNILIDEQEVIQDPRADNENSHRVLFEVIWNKFDELNSQITSSSKPYFRVTTSHSKKYYGFTEMDTSGELEKGLITGGIAKKLCTGAKTLVNADSNFRKNIQGKTLEVLENGEPISGVKKGEGKIWAEVGKEIKDQWDNYDGNKLALLNKIC